MGGQEPTDHCQRWIWFLDVLFGAIVALALERYEPVLGQVWAKGLLATAISVFVTLAVFSFVIYDIAVYHALAKKFPYRLTRLGFGRFYLDLIMAFALYALLVQTLRLDPNWVTILGIISGWHGAALIWHLIARREHGVRDDMWAAVAPHAMFVAMYWSIAWLATGAGRVLELADETRTTFTLVSTGLAILGVSLFRWKQVLMRVAPDASQGAT